MKKHFMKRKESCLARTNGAVRRKDEQSDQSKNQTEISKECENVGKNCKNAETTTGIDVKKKRKTNASYLQTEQEIYKAPNEAAEGQLAEFPQMERGQNGAFNQLDSGDEQDTWRKHEEDACQINQAKQQAATDMVVILKKWKRHNRRRKFLKRFLFGVVAASLIGVCGVSYDALYNKVPSVIRLRANTAQSLDLKVPMEGEVVSASGQGKASWGTDPVKIDLNRNVTVTASAIQNYQMDVKLFGILPFKQVDIQVIDDKELIPVGVTVGIYVKTDGILVVDVGDFEGSDGVSYAPAKYILAAGDYIVKVNNQPIDQREDFINMIEKSDGEEIVLTIRREDKLMEVKVKPAKDRGGTYKLGIWLRDDAQGVGTMTFMDENGNFGALGHGINDVDTSTLMEMEDGTLYKTEIISIKKGSSGSPGEMTGMIVYSNDRILGDINANSLEGIFGTCNANALGLPSVQPIPIGLKQEIVKGPAQILCNVDGKPRYYDVDITAVHLDHDNVNRGIELTVTDPELLSITGGIVQGMSGAPIIQNGKFIGAVTHVLVQDSTRGYGIFIENMLTHEE
jgi:stage IV sporulation protein B